MKHYAIEKDRLILIDEELELSLSELFSIPRLPDNFATHSDVVIQRSESGAIEKAFLEVEKEGKRYRHGEYCVFYPEGQVKARCYYLEGVLHGPSTFYTVAGAVLSESWFYLGKKEGQSVQYYAHGALYSIQRYRGGERTHKQEYYYEDGTCRTVMCYKDGLLEGEVVLFWPSGALKRKTCFVQGKRMGEDAIWNENGERIEELHRADRSS